MSRIDWYELELHIVAEFEATLRRTKRKGQCLRIQACTLVPILHGLLNVASIKKPTASHALIADASGYTSRARKYAKAAFEAASKDHSGFKYQPKIGLVSEEHSGDYCDS